jgi:hypothetical protein
MKKLRTESGRAGTPAWREQSFAHSGVRHALLPPCGGWKLCSMRGGALPLPHRPGMKKLRTESGRAGTPAWREQSFAHSIVLGIHHRSRV